MACITLGGCCQTTHLNPNIAMALVYEYFLPYYPDKFRIYGAQNLTKAQGIENFDIKNPDGSVALSWPQTVYSFKVPKTGVYLFAELFLTNVDFPTAYVDPDDPNRPPRLLSTNVVNVNGKDVRDYENKFGTNVGILKSGDSVAWRAITANGTWPNNRPPSLGVNCWSYVSFGFAFQGPGEPPGYHHFDE